MDVEIKEKENRRHVGRNLQRIRVYLGMKQEALAADLGVNQQVISKIEKQEEIEEILPDVTKEEPVEAEEDSDNFEDTIFGAPKMEEEKDIEEDLKPSFSLTGEMSVLNEEPELLAKPLFNEEESDSEIMPDENESERGNASAIIISIIAVIIGAVVMYSIIRLN